MQWNVMKQVEKIIVIKTENPKWNEREKTKEIDELLCVNVMVEGKD